MSGHEAGRGRGQLVTGVATRPLMWAGRAGDGPAVLWTVEGAAL